MSTIYVYKMVYYIFVYSYYTKDTTVNLTMIY